ncbi:g10629 [Coccomyxa elongata]
MVLVVALVSVLLLATSQQATAVSVRFYANTDLSGDSDSFDGGPLPPKGICGDCKNLNFFSSNPWKSYELDSLGSITLFSYRDCSGQSSSVLTAMSGNIPGPLQGKTKSFKICN